MLFAKITRISSEAEDRDRTRKVSTASVASFYQISISDIQLFLSLFMINVIIDGEGIDKK